MTAGSTKRCSGKWLSLRERCLWPSCAVLPRLSRLSRRRSSGWVTIRHASRPSASDRLEDSDGRKQLDGNAAAGVLAEIFTFEITTARVACVRCGAAGEIGSQMAYVSEIGTVVRCA